MRTRSRFPFSAALAAVAALGALAACEPASPAQQPPAPQQPAKPRADDHRIDAYYVGHSLDSDIPDMVAAFFAARAKANAADAQGAAHPEFRFVEQFMLGTSLANQWAERDRPAAKRSQQPAPFQGHWFDELPKGDWDALVLIDSVPRTASMMPETLDYAGRFVGAALAASPDVRVFVYEPWHCIHSGTPQGCPYDKGETKNLKWRERVAADAPMWDRLVADLQKAQPKAKIALIPAGRSLGVLADALAAGKVPDWKAITDLFDDDIHLNPYGKYFVACLHYAALAGRSPEGLPFLITDRNGKSFWDTPNWAKKQWSAPKAETVKSLQEIAWTCSQGVAQKPAKK